VLDPIDPAVVAAAAADDMAQGVVVVFVTLAREQVQPPPPNEGLTAQQIQSIPSFAPTANGLSLALVLACS
jgi:hypothetical protein